jgi:hypothetical protein
MSDTLQGLQVTSQKLEVDSKPYVSQLDPVYELDWNAIYTFIKENNMTILDQNFEFERTGWNVSHGTLFFVQSTPPLVTMDLRRLRWDLQNDADNAMQRIDRFAARHQGFARG